MQSGDTNAPPSPLVVYGSAIEFDDIGLAYGDVRRAHACGGRTRGVASPTEEKFRVLVTAPLTFEVVRADADLCSEGNTEGADSGTCDENGGEDDEEARMMEEMARMGLPTGFGKPTRGWNLQPDGDDGADDLQDIKEDDMIEVTDIGTSRSHVRFMDAHDELVDDTVDDPVDGAQGDEKRQQRRRTVTVKKKKKSPEKKYWLQRYSLFSLYDKGIQIDDEGWYSVTPEVIAWHHASMIVKAANRGCVVYDVFGGVGGNAIQLALAGCHVIVTEICPDKAYMIRNNARVYGVQNRVDVMIGDALEVASRLRPGLVDAVLLSPPWGGPAYSNDRLFDVQQMGGYPELGVGKLLQMAFDVLKVSSAALWLPRTSDLQQLGIEVAKLGRRVNCHVELARINGVDKAITVYVGDTELARSKCTRKPLVNYGDRQDATDIARLVGKLHAQSEL